MKSIFKEADYQEIRKRIENLQVTQTRQWGEMSVAQMLAHCSIGFEQAAGTVRFEDKGNFLMKTLVKLFVRKALKKGDLGKNQKTFPEFEIREERDFETEKARLLKGIDTFFEDGQKNRIGRHPYFGKFSLEDWGRLQFVHTDHHLKQFAA